MNRLINYLPDYYKKSELFKEITRVESKEFEKLYENIKDIDRQFIIDTATWGLDIYEKELGLPIKPDKALSERRSIIKAKLRGVGKVDNIMLKAIVEAFTRQIVTIEFNGRINIAFKDSRVIDLSNLDMYRFIEDVKPAHLNYNIESRAERILKTMSKLRHGFSAFPLCNTIEAGEWPEQQDYGKLNESIILSVADITDQDIEFREVATIEASERLYEDYQYAEQATSESTLKTDVSKTQKDVIYIEANESKAGEHPFIVVEGNIVELRTKVHTSTRSNEFKYKQPATIVSSESIYDEYEFAEISDFELGMTSRHHVSLKELEYVKTNTLKSGEYPNATDEMKIIESRINKSSQSKGIISEYGVCGDILAGGDKK